jgi:hypothetical protein
MKIFVDIDDTICKSKSLDYSLATPLQSRIQKINILYDRGHTIVYWTARGTKTGIQWFQTTLAQLQSWGCKFHELRMGKPDFDLFIDDKAMNSESYFNDLAISSTHTDSLPKMD